MNWKWIGGNEGNLFIYIVLYILKCLIWLTGGLMAGLADWLTEYVFNFSFLSFINDQIFNEADGLMPPTHSFLARTSCEFCYPFTCSRKAYWLCRCSYERLAMLQGENGRKMNAKKYMVKNFAHYVKGINWLAWYPSTEFISYFI